MAPPLTFKTNKTMAIKKTTAVKKSDPPSKKKSGPPTTQKFLPNAMIAGKDFGKIGNTGNYYYMEGGPGMGGIRKQKDMPSLDPKKTQGQQEREGEFRKSLRPGMSTKQIIDYGKYLESVRAKSNAYKGAKAVAATKPTTLAKKVTIKTTMAKKK